MKKKFNDIEFVFPKEFDLDIFDKVSLEEPFSSNAIAYLSALSLILYKDPRSKNFPDLATFAFFCRKANIVQLKKKFYPENNLRLGRGTVFHITPSNVPVTFAYSLICGILSGNKNIVRLPSRKYEQVEIICNAIRKLSREHKHLAFSSRIALVGYDQQSSATAFFSSLCDVRIIWGGNASIEEIRKNTLSAHAFDVIFADRYSLCLINADVYINEKTPQKIAMGFYNDTYLLDQNACTSPHLIVWLGEDKNVETAKKLFWGHLYDMVKERYTIQPHSAVDKLIAFYNQAAQLEGIKKTKMPDNLIWRIELKDLSKDIDKYRCNSGYFSEYKAASIFELSKIINHKYQTLSYYGIEKEEFMKFFGQIKPDGIDRIVPIGKTTDFSLTWDGINMIDTLSRKIELLE